MRSKYVQGQPTVYGMRIIERPRDNHGRFVPTACELCGDGSLKHQGSGHWTCDGLIDPEDPNKELQACPGHHFDGDARVVRVQQ
jgi:hypothetical protein